ncbi:5-formyltetrahydrofolate cyclo-ligase [Emcibacter sp.]|uniref:5-formyltetrahydrofolate cyclo-ligase n=1 Tax=Emcibacter sp. TaxID=1979954 RepID=UPI002AA64C70|nr:5-formyltetrahydrofolate cyclo-ligase [Emcibacter sp.]
MTTKKKLRTELAAQRLELKDEIGEMAARQVASQLILLPELEEADIVAGYHTLGSELDCLTVLKALHAAHFRIALPVIVARDHALKFREWDMVHPLEDGGHGTRQPDEKCHEVMPDVMLVPLLAFDGAGHRLGYGGGFYDRTLHAYRSRNEDLLTIGLAFEGQRRDDVFADVHDQPLDMIITEENIYRFQDERTKGSL